MSASRLGRAASVAVAVGVLLVGASPAAAQTSAPPPQGPLAAPPLVSDGVDTGVLQTLTGHSRFSVGQHGSSMDHLPAVRENVELVSKLQMNTPVEFRFDPTTGDPDPTEPPVVPGQIADVAVYKNFAYLNSWSDPSCKRGGIFVVDISNPAAPQQVGFLPAAANTRHGEGAHVRHHHRQQGRAGGQQRAAAAPVSAGRDQRRRHRPLGRDRSAQPRAAGAGLWGHRWPGHAGRLGHGAPTRTATSCGRTTAAGRSSSSPTTTSSASPTSTSSISPIRRARSRSRI